MLSGRRVMGIWVFFDPDDFDDMILEGILSAVSATVDLLGKASMRSILLLVHIDEPRTNF